MCDLTKEDIRNIVREELVNYLKLMIETTDNHNKLIATCILNAPHFVKRDQTPWKVSDFLDTDEPSEEEIKNAWIDLIGQDVNLEDKI